MLTAGSLPVVARNSGGKPDRVPLLVALTALAGYVLIFLLLLNHYGDLRDFIFIGKKFIDRGDISSIIKMDPNYEYLEDVPGYDGQFAYFIALDPENARYYVDQNRVSYRYTRILYPMLARSLALGNPEWVPLTMIVVNLLAVTGGTLAVALWCRERRLSPWLGLVYAFYIGQVMAFSRDLNEILAYSLVAVAVYLFDHIPQRPILAAMCFGLSALAKETTLLFAVIFTIALMVRVLKDKSERTGRQRWVKPALFGALAIGPALVWQLCLFWWLGDAGFRQGAGLYLVPFANLYNLYPLDQGALELGGGGDYPLDGLPGSVPVANVEVAGGPLAQGAMGDGPQCPPVRCAAPTGQSVRHLRFGAYRHSGRDGRYLGLALRALPAMVCLLRGAVACADCDLCAESRAWAWSLVKRKRKT